MIASNKHVSPHVRFVDQFLNSSPAAKLSGLLLGQLDAFDRVGDTFGREQSEALCAEYTAQLKNTLSKNAAIIRLSERRFAICLALDSAADIVAVAEDLATDLEPSLVIADDTFLIDITIGVALCPTHADNADELFHCAELALKTARDNDLRCAVYQGNTSQQQTVLWRLEAELEQAIRFDRFKVYYQPQLDLGKRRISGCEALVRWRSESGRLILPGSFIPVAERTGYIVPLTWLIFDHVIRNVKNWRQLPRPFSVAINVSPKILHHTEFFERLRKLKAALNNCGAGVILELTEDSLLECRPSLDDKLAHIRKMGVHLAIDDFGKGRSSLSYLKEIAATEVKIDRRFTEAISVDGKDRYIVKAIVDLGRAFGMKVIAEGVDSDEGLRAVSKLGCAAAQGFIIARPMHGDLLTNWISNYSTRGTPANVHYGAWRMRSG